MIDKIQIKKILIVLPNWIGDAVMSVPAISQIRERFPSARITIIGLSHISELFYEGPYVDEIRVYKKDFPSNKGGLRGIWGMGGLTATGLSLRSEKFDMVLLLPNSFRSALLVHLAGIPLRCGYNRDARGLLLNRPVRFTPQIKKLHQVEYYLHLARSIEENRRDRNVPPIDFSPPISPSNKGGNRGIWGMGALLFLSQEEIQQAKETLGKNQITPEDLLIGINPGAAYGSSKRWYPERFSQVAAALDKKYHAKIILFGGPGERDIAEEIVRTSGPSLLNMAGQTTIRGLMALLSQCRLLIASDSGPMHIAAALGVPVVAIFGSTDPALTTPIGTGHVVIRKTVPCSPCFRRECPTDLMCMDLIQVEDVLGGVEKILGR
ncbi:MAG: glycosyltransferase family 9 protein [Nitrospirae bacterium]|nr:glycosyltransferase family 9 protein [Nitrospirota bacterium]